MKFIPDYAPKICKELIRYRACASNKKFDYSTRLMYDSFAARRENIIIEMSNQLISQMEKSNENR